MLYIVGNKKYISGEREPKQTSLTILRSQKLHLGNSFVYHTNLTENDALFLVSSGSIESENKIIESGNIIYVPKYSGFNFKKNNGYKRSVELSKENNIYRQNYCGCHFSRVIGIEE